MILQQSLKELRKTGEQRALLTVDLDNIPSIKVIEDNGGKVTSSLRGLLLANVILEWTPAHDLSGTGDLEPLRRAPV